MPQDTTFDSTEFVRAGIEELRRNLLDFSTRNRLLSFKHSERGTDFIRAVDELPGQVYNRLNGGRMRFKALPDDLLNAPDEVSPTFLDALQDLGASDEDYRKWLDSAEKNAQSTFEAERMLRDKVRVKLGLNPLLRKGKLDPVAFAAACGIASSYDLPEPGMAKNESHSDRFIQTLFTQDDLDRRGRKLYERYQDHLQEKGINVLYAAFGFLEWYEDETSETAHHAPLLLQQLNMVRKTDQGKIGLELSGEADLELNATLFEYLKKDFHIALPAFTDPGESGEQATRNASGADDAAALEAWLCIVAKVIGNKRRWRVRRFVTIGTFPFSRMGLYKDLEASTWKNNALVAHDVVAKLLGGLGRYEGEVGEDSNLDYPLDAPEFNGKVPSIILDADSSQHSAIVDALNGASIVVQGPPGTGKSQTIANIIASALDRGKRILFVAEKSAALNVVASRLQHCGLGPFLLELHSDKARKTDVIASLKERLDLPAPAHPSGLERRLEQRRITRDTLARYVALIAKPVGRLGRSLQPLMWYATRYSAELGGELPSRLEKILVPKAREIDQHSLEGVRQSLDVLASARDQVIKAFGSIKQHPWQGLGATNPFGVDEIIKSARKALTSFARLTTELELIGDGGLRVPANAKALTGWLKDVARVPAMSGDQHLVSIALKSAKSLSEIGSLIDGWRVLASGLGLHFADISAVDADVLGTFLADCSALGVAPNENALGVEIVQSEVECSQLEGCLMEIQRLCRRVGVEWQDSTEDALALTEAFLVLRQTSVDALSIRTHGMRAEVSDVVIAQAQRKANGLRKRETELEERIDLGRARREYSPDTLYRLSDALTGARLLTLFKPDAHRANQVWNRLVRHRAKSGRAARGADLRKLAEHLAEVGRFNDNEQLQLLLGPTFVGHDTDFDLIAEAAGFLRQTAATIGRISTLQRAAQTFIEGEAHALVTMGQQVAPGVLERVRKTLRRAEESGETLQQRHSRCLERRNRLEEARQRAMRLGVTTDTSLPTERGANGQWVVVKELERCRTLGMSLPQLKVVLGASFEPLLADTTPLKFALSVAADAERAQLHESIMGELRRAASPERRREELQTTASALNLLVEACRSAWSEFVVSGEVDETAFVGGSAAETGFAEIAARLQRALSDEFSIADWMRYRRARLAIAHSQAAAIGDAFDGIDQPERRLGDAFELCLVKTLIRSQLGTAAKELAELGGSTLDDARARFTALDKEIIELESRRIAAEVQRRTIEYGNDRGPKSGWTGEALVRNEVSKKKRHLPIRTLIRRSQGALLAMKPVWLMSPLTVARYAPQAQDLFDMVIIDEASQMRPADAVGAIARAPQAIIVGDPQQLPPTDFFSAPSTDADVLADGAADGHSSILDLAEVRLPRRRMLRWHYRSRHQSLIALSNREFYDSKLVIFPAAESVEGGLGMEHTYVGGTYLIGGTNPNEARAVVERARQSIEEFPERSIGIATTNLHQRELIIEELERLTATDKRVAEYRAQWQDTLEPLFVKNLENVQGDERDVIIISTVFGRDEAGKVAQRFGPINSEAGHRRLNVLFTRAKLQLILMTSIKPTDILASASTHRGVHVLKAFLEFAASGRLESGEPTGRAADSDFEVHVARLLERSGYIAVPQVGVQGYRIDIGVRHPEYAYGFLAGIECDGKTYHSGITVRDRDRLRQEILEGLGWRLYRIWSTDWFAHPEREIRKLVKWLDETRTHVSQGQHCPGPCKEVA